MRVLVADDQAEVRSAMRFLLEHEPNPHVVGEAVDATDLLDMVRRRHPDLVLLDWELPGRKVQDLLSLLHSTRPDLMVIALSGRPEVRRSALDAGAHAFVSKGDPPERLLAAIRDASRKRSGI
jgi:DNA-binding NarL/FixJ family response regulator